MSLVQLFQIFNSDVMRSICSYNVGLHDLACPIVKTVESYDMWRRMGIEVTYDQLLDDELGALAVREDTVELKIALLLRGAVYERYFTLDEQFMKDNCTHVRWVKPVTDEDRHIYELVREHSAIHAAEHFYDEMRAVMTNNIRCMILIGDFYTMLAHYNVPGRLTSEQMSYMFFRNRTEYYDRFIENFTYLFTPTVRVRDITIMQLCRLITENCKIMCTNV